MNNENKEDCDEEDVPATNKTGPFTHELYTHKYS